jgi:hypothetical protein
VGFIGIITKITRAWQEGLTFKAWRRVYPLKQHCFLIIYSFLYTLIVKLISKPHQCPQKLCFLRLGEQIFSLVPSYRFILYPNVVYLAESFATESLEQTTEKSLEVFEATD